jgi:hypothetical protein
MSNYLNNIIRNYDYFYLDFSSDQIRKKEFDLIRLLIHPKQVIGLKLGQNRFNLIEKYLIQINDEQTFSRLRSFYLEKSILYNEQLSKWIYSKLLMIQ